MKKLLSAILTVCLMAVPSFGQSVKVVGAAKVVGSVSLGAAGATNATFVNFGQCNVAGTATSCTVTPGTAIPIGDLIVVDHVNSGNGIVAPTDSHGDTFACASAAVEATNGNTLQLCVFKAVASTTTVTCNQTFSSHNFDCIVAWYTPGSLSGVIDQSIGADSPNSQTWTSTATTTLANSNDLVVGSAGTNNTSLTTTYSDGSTQRATCVQGSCGFSDRNASGTTGVAASGTWSNTGVYAAAGVMAIK